MNGKNIKGSTRIGGLIGRGLSHSLSPLIHNTAAEILGLDVVYVPFDTAVPPSLAFFQQMLATEAYGFNVTVPYKEAVASLFLKAEAQTSPVSCNTLIAKGTYWDVTSTDARGFFAGLREIEQELKDFTAVIFLGYGGAAKALIEHVAKEAPALPLFVLKRGNTLESEGASGQASPFPFRSLSFRPFEPLALDQLLRTHPKALLIQCTSAPLRGDDLSRFNLANLKGAFVDLVYGTPSALLAQSQELSIPCQDGIPMLIHQALLSQQLWWGQAASFSDMKAAILRQRNS